MSSWKPHSYLYPAAASTGLAQHLSLSVTHCSWCWAALRRCVGPGNHPAQLSSGPHRSGQLRPSPLRTCLCRGGSGDSGALRTKALSLVSPYPGSTYRGHWEGAGAKPHPMTGRGDRISLDQPVKAPQASATLHIPPSATHPPVVLPCHPQAWHGAHAEPRVGLKKEHGGT